MLPELNYSFRLIKFNLKIYSEWGTIAKEDKIMRVKQAFILAAFLLFSVGIFSGCKKPPKEKAEPPGKGKEQVKQLGRLMFDVPRAFTDVGTLDTPRITLVKNGDIHLVYLYHDGTSQKIMYSKMEKGEFTKPSFLSQDEGAKKGGAFITARTESSIVAYWVNVPVTGGQLLYKASENSGKTWTIEKQWNQRGEVRWPCALTVDSDIIAYFLVRTGGSWELVSNKNFSAEKEPLIATVKDTPFHLQGVTDGVKNVWLAYFSRVENSGGGRIVLLTSSDRGETFKEKFLFDNLIIRSEWSFFSIARSVQGKTEVLHLIFTEETPEYTKLFYSRSENGGIDFTSPIPVIESEEPLTRAPLIAANGRFVFIATADTDDEGPALRYVFSEDGGKSFDQPAIATRNVTNPETISGAIDANGRVTLVWDDIAPVQTGVGEQLFRLKGILRGE